MGARFVDTSYWDGSARGPTVVLVMLVTFAALRAFFSGERKLIPVVLVLALGCFATHHMAVLLILFAIAYVLAAFQVQFLFPRFRARKKQVALAWNLMLLVTVTATAFALFEYFGNLAMMNLRKSSLFNIEPAFLSVVLNIGVSYANQIGVILFCAPFALLIILRSSHISTERLFLITLLIAFIPMLGNSLYVSMLLSPFVACLGTIWISRVKESSKNRTVAVLVVALFVATIFIPLWSSNKWNSEEYLSGDRVEVDPRVYSDATYLGTMYPDGFAICSNVNTLSVQLAVTGGTRFPASSVPAAINGDITLADIRRNVTWSGRGFPASLYVWFVYNNGPTIDLYMLGLVVYGMAFLTGHGGTTQPAEYFASHSKLLAIMDNRLPYEYAGEYGIYPSVLAAQLKDAQWQSNQPKYGGMSELASYMVYESGRITVYALELPF
jgi:hypothetical protein